MGGSLHFFLPPYSGEVLSRDLLRHIPSYRRKIVLFSALFEISCSKSSSPSMVCPNFWGDFCTLSDSSFFPLFSSDFFQCLLVSYGPKPNFSPVHPSPSPLDVALARGFFFSFSRIGAFFLFSRSVPISGINVTCFPSGPPQDRVGP